MNSILKVLITGFVFLPFSIFAKDLILLANGKKMVGDVMVLDMKRELMRVRFSDGKYKVLTFKDVAGIKTNYSAQQQERNSSPNRRISSIDSTNFETSGFEPRESYYRPVRWGGKLGVNFASASVQSGSVSSRTGFAVGGGNELAFVNWFSLQSELTYSQYGYSDSGLTLSYDTLEAQLLGKFSFLDRSSFVRPSGVVGFATGYRISSRVTGQGLDLDASGASNSVMLSGVIGASVLFGSEKNVGIGLDLRYLFGLSNVNTASAVSVKNSTFYLGTTFLF